MMFRLMFAMMLLKSACSASPTRAEWEIFVVLDGQIACIRTNHTKTFDRGGEYTRELIPTVGRCLAVSVDPGTRRMATLEESAGLRSVRIYDPDGRWLGEYFSGEPLSLPAFSPDGARVALVDQQHGILVAQLPTEGQINFRPVCGLPRGLEMRHASLLFLDDSHVASDAREEVEVGRHIEYESWIWILDLNTNFWAKCIKGSCPVRASSGFAFHSGPVVEVFDIAKQRSRAISNPSARSHSKAAFHGMVLSPCGRYLAYDVASAEHFTLAIEDLKTHRLRLLKGAAPVSGFGAWLEKSGSDHGAGQDNAHSE